MSDLVEQLRQWARDFSTDVDCDLFANAADEIERLRIGLRDARDVIGQLRGALAEAAAEVAAWQHETDLAKAKIDSLQSQLECARRDAIEECARLADGWNMNMVAEDIATKIRALIDDLRSQE